MLGEVGLDKSFRLPERAYTREPEGPAGEDQQDPTGQTEADDAQAAVYQVAPPAIPVTRKRRLTSLQTPIEHQVAILSAQVGLAIELGRNVSMHSVRAQGATLDFFEEMTKRYPGGIEAGFEHINLDLHSCSLSVETLTRVQVSGK